MRLIDPNEEIMRYDGRLVLVSGKRRVAGGTACDVRRAPVAQDWPWTVDSWTGNYANMTPVRCSDLTDAEVDDLVAAHLMDLGV